MLTEKWKRGYVSLSGTVHSTFKNYIHCKTALRTGQILSEIKKNSHLRWSPGFFLLVPAKQPHYTIFGQKKFTYLTVSSKYLENHAIFHFGTISRKSPEGAYEILSCIRKFIFAWQNSNKEDSLLQIVFKGSFFTAKWQLESI